MFYSDDPAKDFDRWDMEQQKHLDSLPKCVICGEPIQAEHYYNLHEGITCPNCLENEFRQENYL